MTKLVDRVVEFIRSDPTIVDPQQRNETYKVLQGIEVDGIDMQVWETKNGNGPYQVVFYRDQQAVYRQDIYPSRTTDGFCETTMSESNAVDLLYQYERAIQAKTIDI